MIIKNIAVKLTYITIEFASDPKRYPSINIAKFQRALEVKMSAKNQGKFILAIPAGMEIYCPKPKVKGARATESFPYLEKNF